MLYLTVFICAFVVPLTSWWLVARNIEPQGWRKIAIASIVIATVPLVIIGRLVNLDAYLSRVDFVINRLEHICLIGSLVLGIGSLFWRYFRRVHPIFVIVLGIGFAFLFGLGIELFQAYIRVYENRLITYQFRAWYLDSLLDLSADCIGGFALYLIIVKPKKPRLFGFKRKTVS